MDRKKQAIQHMFLLQMRNRRTFLHRPETVVDIHIDDETAKTRIKVRDPAKSLSSLFSELINNERHFSKTSLILPLHVENIQRKCRVFLICSSELK